jgi:hypothetical protein
MSFLITSDERPVRATLGTPRMIDTAVLTGKPVVSVKKGKIVSPAATEVKLSKKEQAKKEAKAATSGAIASLLAGDATKAKVRDYMEERVKALCDT